eukprot:TRINITY_DN322_c0_g1_i2.p1 TRINITY_DN322_c0_g1~~TRINITY_DN322_c0_g1_i2.p1  ORF type:complete len:216 (+),score=24.39 TRINITY_DN322_c0_g1_i2:87-734(+)
MSSSTSGTLVGSTVYNAPLPDYSYQFKYVVVGPAGVGKSSLLLQFTDHEWYPQTDVTVGVEFGVKIVEVQEGVWVKIQIWDTAGAESFRAVTNNYYRGAHAALLVYDITRRDSFGYIEGWLEEIYAHSHPEIVVILVGNKCDLISRRVVQREEGAQFAKDRNLMFLECSAKDATNVDNAYLEACKILVKKVKEGKIKLENSQGLPSPSSQKKECC